MLAADREASKTYLARVRGAFPSEFDDETKARVVETARTNCAASDITFVDEHTVRISCPLRCQSARDGVWECHADGKPSETLVHLLRKPDAATSVVQCKPVTGRTHQIRLHLQLIGFPIANDPCYGGELHYGETAARLSEIAAATEAKDGDTLPAATKEVDLSTPRQEDESEEDFMRRTCTWCRVGDAEAFNETQLHCSRIWLHALEYKVRRHDMTSMNEMAIDLCMYCRVAGWPRVSGSSTCVGSASGGKLGPECTFEQLGVVDGAVVGREEGVGDGVRVIVIQLRLDG